MATNPLKKLLRRAGLAAAALVLAVVVAELVLRSQVVAETLPPAVQLSGIYVQEGAGFYRLRPGYEGQLVVAGRRTRVHTNSLGLRGPEPSPRPPAGGRVLVLGDSFPFGFGVAEDETLAARLAPRLGERLGVEVEVLDGGVPGYGPALQRELFARLDPELAPDAVVSCVFLGNDFEDDAQPDRAVVAGQLLTGSLARVAKNSLRARLALRYRVAFLLEKLLAEHVPAWAFDPAAAGAAEDPDSPLADFPAPGRRHAGLFLDALEETPALRRILERSVAALVDLRDALAPRPLVVALLPAVEHVVPARYEAALRGMGFDPTRYRRGTLQRRLLARLEAAGIPAVDLTPAFAAHPDPESLYLPGDGHFGPAGHELAADVLEAPVATALGR